MKYFALLALTFLPLLALAQATDTSFVPLTNIPVLFETGKAITTPEGLSLFLNNVYKICIGIAAVVAVLQIMRAGIMYMGSESGFAEKKEAKNLIALSIGGLILVLAPTIVFSIINPDILTLKIKGIDALKVEPRTIAPLPSGTDNEPTHDPRICTGWNTPEYVVLPNNKTCSDSKGAGWGKIDTECCLGSGTPQAGAVCCAKDKNYTAPAPQPGDEGTFTFKIFYKDEDWIKDSKGKEELRACWATHEETKTSLALCESALDAARSGAPSPGAATAKNCLASEMAAPTPTSTWNALRALPQCPTI